MSLASILARMAKLPTNIASATLLGMAKIGSGLSITEEGVLSVSAGKTPTVVTTFADNGSSVKNKLELGTNGYTPNRIMVTMNGVVLTPVTDYTATDGANIEIISSTGLDDTNATVGLRDVLVVYHL